MGRNIADDLALSRITADLQLDRLITPESARIAALNNNTLLAGLTENSALQEAQRSMLMEAEQRIAALSPALHKLESVNAAIQESIGSVRLSEMALGLERFRDEGLLPELNGYLEQRQLLADNLSRLDTTHLAGVADVRDMLSEQIQQIQDATGVGSRFFDQAEIERLSPTILEDLSGQLNRALLPTQREFADLAASIAEPLAGAIDTQSVCESVARLSAIGKSLQGDPYDSLTNTTLQSLLGDWSHQTPDATIFSDWQMRQAFYRDTGFDRLLTVLPEPVFTDSLYDIGILRPELFPPTPPPYESDESEWSEESEETEETDEQLALYRQRVLETSDLVHTVEIYLRAFIHKEMARRYGQDWVKHRVPAELRKQWQETRAKASRDGEKEERLLWFANFGDYSPIIIRNDNWNDIFKPIFRDKDDIKVSFRRLQPFRNPTMHSRIITKEDFLLVSVETRRILKAIGKVEDEDNED